LGSLLNDKNAPHNEIEQIAFTTALDSIIWSNKDEPRYFDIIDFPKCFELAEMAVKLTSKFGGYSIEEKKKVQEKLLR
jgi:hypothetical protein